MKQKTFFIGLIFFMLTLSIIFLLINKKPQSEKDIQIEKKNILTIDVIKPGMELEKFIVSSIEIFDDAGIIKKLHITTKDFPGTIPVKGRYQSDEYGFVNFFPDREYSLTTPYITSEGKLMLGIPENTPIFIEQPIKELKKMRGFTHNEDVIEVELEDYTIEYWIDGRVELRAKFGRITNALEVFTDDTRQWATYENTLLGIRFKYPKFYTIHEEEQSTLDIGKQFSVTVSGPIGAMTVRLTSEDYEIGINGDGCCFYFSAPPLDLTLSHEELTKIINQKLGRFIPISALEKTKIVGREALHFYNFESYTSIWPKETFLLPLHNQNFSNMMIVGPALGDFPYENDREETETKNKAKKSVENKSFLRDPDIARSYKTYQTMLDTLEINQ